MILVDTSIWIDHLRQNEAVLAAELNRGRVSMHPFVLGEIACGNLRNREELLHLLSRLPSAPMASEPEACMFIDRHRLMGWGIGYLDVHLLASTSLAAPARLWTRDRRLLDAATRLDLALRP